MSAPPAAQLFDSAVGPLETVAEPQRGFPPLIRKHANIAARLARAASGTGAVNGC